jgi:hypothetical protein
VFSLFAFWAEAVGLTNTGNRLFNQNTAGIADTAQTDDQFGRALAAGDFNGDGRLDTAVGVPYEDTGSFTNDGLVHVIYGTSTGLTAVGSQVWTQTELPGTDPESQDRFGFSLVVGDFNGDYYDDLAVGSPYEDNSAIDAAGYVHVLYGSFGGLQTNNSQVLFQGSGGVEDNDEISDLFGYTLAAADFNRDGYDELVVGVPYEDIDGVSNAGMVHVFPGTPSGLDRANDTVWHQNQPASIPGANTASDLFAYSLSAGDYDGDWYPDLAVGVPYKEVSGVNDAGAVIIIKGSPAGLTPTGSRQINQGANGFEGVLEIDDYFGWSLASGDINNDGRGDLVVGIPYEEGTIDNAGYFQMIYGSVTGLTGATDQLWSQDSAGISDIQEASDYFGYTVAVADFDGDGYDDVAVGVPYEDFGSVINAGSVNVIFGSASGLTVTGDQFWNQDVSTIEGDAATSERFSQSMAVGDLNGDGAADLVVGVPWDIVGSTADGSINVIYGSRLPTPEVRVHGNSLTISDGDTTPRTNDFTDFGATIVGAPISRTFSVTNSGTGTLTTSGLTVPVGFTVTEALSASITAGNRDTFTVRLNAAAVGTYTGIVSFANNDANENPYNFAISGFVQAAPAPELEVRGNGLIITDGDGTPSTDDHTDFGETSVGLPINRNFTVKNIGTAALTTAGLTVPSGYTVIDALAANIAAGSQDTMTVRLNAAAAGTYTGIVSFTSNDSNESPNTFTIKGVVTAPLNWWSAAQNLGGGWYRYFWFGDFSVMGGGWIWHNRHGFMYSASTSADNIWLWTQDMGWLWTGNGTAPFFFRQSDGAWIWYQQWSQNPRWFFNFSANTWEQRNP